jgi:ketopantoate reductase
VSQGPGFFPRWAPDGNTVYYWRGNSAVGTLWAARIQREPTPVVLSRDSLFSGRYNAEAYDLHPDGDRVVVTLDASSATASAGGTSETERFVVVTNWFEELMQRMGN